VEIYPFLIVLPRLARGVRQPGPLLGRRVFTEAMG
jgi:hypothetical protein